MRGRLWWSYEGSSKGSVGGCTKHVFGFCVGSTGPHDLRIGSWVKDSSTVAQ